MARVQVAAGLTAQALDIAAGEFTAVMGPSGSGKSTLMHCCAALDTADSGSVVIGDQDLTRLKDKALTRLRRDEIGFVFQSFNLVPRTTAPRRGSIATTPADWSFRSASRTGVRLTPNSAASVACRSRESDGISPLRIRAWIAVASRSTRSSE